MKTSAERSSSSTPYSMCATMWPRAHTHFVSPNLSLSCGGEPRVHYGSELKAEAGGWKIIMFFLFLFFFKCLTGFTVIEFIFVTNKPKTLMGCFSLLCQKEITLTFFFWLLWWCKVLQFDLFFKDYSFCEKKNGIKQFSCLWNKIKYLLFFAVTEPQVPKFSEHMGQDAR